MIVMNLRILIKFAITAGVITGVSELGKRYSWIAAILASLPLTSILAMTWLYLDTKDSQKVSDLSYGILWAVLPSLVFFVVLPVLLRSGLKFAVAMPLACAIMFVTYTLYILALRRVGVSF